MKLLVAAAYFEPASQYGGPVTVIAEACRALAKLGVSVTVFTTTANGAGELDVPLARPVSVSGIETWYFPRRSPRGYFRSPAMASELQRRAGDFDVLHTHGLWCHANLAVRRASLRAGVPYVATLHGGLEPVMLRKGWLKKRLYWLAWERRNLEAAAAVLALTEDERRQAQLQGVQAPVVVIPHGLDVSEYAEAPPRSLLRELHPSIAEEPYVLYLGRLHPKKGIELLLAALPAVLTRAPAVRLVVAGAGEAAYESALRTAAGQLGEGRVLFAGHVSGRTKRALLAHALAFCLPSQSEGLPVACLEALFSNTPLVISRECGLPQVAEEGAGFVVDRTPGAIAETITQLATDEALRLCMVGRAGAYARRDFDSQMIAQRTLDLYREIVASGRAR